MNLSVVVGTEACNAKCAFCVSHQTLKGSLPLVSYNLKRLEVAARLAERRGVDTALITGRGEPTLYPEHITSVLEVLSDYFPIIELQTNAIDQSLYGYAYRWWDLGLTTVCVSCVSLDVEKNRAIYGPEYRELLEVVKALKNRFSLRLSCVGLKNHVDTFDAVLDLAEGAKELGFRQCTWRPVWYKNRVAKLTQSPTSIHTAIADLFPRLATIGFGEVYDINGCNLCLTDCMTRDTVRQIIVYPNGEVTYDWDLDGAVIL